MFGDYPTASFQGFLYYVLFANDNSHFLFVYPMKHKSEVFKHFLSYKLMVENQFNTIIKILRTDGGKEYCNPQMSQFLDLDGIIHQISCPYTLKQNVLAK